jgi:hypothetical protein
LSSLTLCFPIGFHFLAYPNLFGIKGFVVVVVVEECFDKGESTQFLSLTNSTCYILLVDSLMEQNKFEPFSYTVVQT